LQWELLVSDLPDFDDWLELLGLKSTMDSLMSGSVTADDAEEAIRSSFESYPDVSQDYIAILEQALIAVDTVRKSIVEQQQAMEDFNRQAEPLGLAIAFDSGRLLTTDEQVELERRREQLQRSIEERQEELARLQREAEQLQREVAEEQEAAAAELDDAVKEHEEAQSDYEDAVADLEDLLDEEVEAAR
jgi:chromosome segregation ATPase